MARRRGGGRRRRNHFGFLYKLLTVLVICGVIVAALTMFFKVGKVEITGEHYYREEQILEASGVAVGDNLFLLNKPTVVKRLTEQLPYIEQVRITRRMPDTLRIQVTECGTAFAVSSEEAVWLMSDSGKILDTAPEDVSAWPMIDGCELLAPSVGSYMALAQEEQFRQESLLALLEAVKEAGALKQVNAIHLTDSAEIVMEYAGRFDVKMPYGADYDKMMAFLTIVMDTLETNETGIIDLTTEGAAHVQKK